MQLLIFHLVGEIWWRVEVGTPALIPGAHLGPYGIVNPAAYQLLGDHPEIDSSWPPFVHRGQRVLRTKELLLAVEGTADATQIREDFALAVQFLTRLRYLSRQAKLANDVVARSGPIDGSALNRHPIPPPFEIKAHLREHVLDWAATEDDIREATWTIAEAVPAHHGLLLDAQEAAIDKDHRTAILLAAMAAETLAGTVADVAQAHKDGTQCLDDPVFKFLRARAKFANLLHEVDLYCRGCSLLATNEKLYQRALRLYQTRNKIVHEGLPPEKDSFLSLTSEGAAEAIGTTRALFQWFGETRPYPDPIDSTMVPIP